ncbi:MAG TPA: DUF167 domain-containing protein [Candidatus Babeliales bacterium]|nr:DUF167 domain-containing protein [Candidatus Babeliales bacterium]
MPCEFDVHVVGKAGHVKWANGKVGRLECYVTHPPLSDAANKELIKHIAEAVGVSHSKVQIIHGIEDQHKKIKISDHHITMDTVLQALGLKAA